MLSFNHRLVHSSSFLSISVHHTGKRTTVSSKETHNLPNWQKHSHTLAHGYHIIQQYWVSKQVDGLLRNMFWLRCQGFLSPAVTLTDNPNKPCFGLVFYSKCERPDKGDCLQEECLFTWCDVEKAHIFNGEAHFLSKRSLFLTEGYHQNRTII